MIIVKAPLRVSFLGGSTDIHDFYSREDGVCLGSAINKYVYVILHKRFQDNICVGYTQKEYATTPGKIRHDLVREAMLLTKVKNPIEISTIADIPSWGSGLGSSSSILTALLKALYIYQGVNMTNSQLAQAACDIEINRLKRPIGKQDQYWAAFGGFNVITFKKQGYVSIHKTSLNNEELTYLNHNLLLFHTGIARNSAEVLGTIGDNRKIYEIKKRLKDLALHGIKILEEKKFDEFGEILGRGWAIKRELSSKISMPRIDKLYQKALDSGALGGKILGAGGGGFFLFYCPIEKQKKFRKEFHLKELPFRFDHYGVREIFNDE